MLSIVIAAYNVEEYIDKCLQSIFNQTSNDYEIIVVNDGSTDKTREIIEKYSSKIKLINQNNLGLIEARKSGLKHVKGEYIYFLDGDDWLDPTMIEKVSQYFDDEKDIILFHTKTCYENGRVGKYSLYYGEVFNLESVLTQKIMPAIWGKVIRRQFIVENKISFLDNVTFGEDLSITVALFVHNPRVEIIDEALHNYFVRNTSVTNTVSERIYDIIKVLDYIDEIITQKYGDKYKTQIEDLYIQKLIGYAYVYSVRHKQIRKKILNRYLEKEIDYRKQSKFDSRVILAKILSKSNDNQEEILAKILIAKNKISLLTKKGD